MSSAEHKEQSPQGNVPNLRFPEFSGEWEKFRLQDVCSFYSGGTPSSTQKNFYNGEIPFIRSGEIHSETTELTLTQEGLNNSSAKLVKEGDLLLALYGATSGDIAISQINGAINQAILCIRSKHNNQFIKSTWVKHCSHILQVYLQGGQGNLSAEIVKKLKFSFPNNKEQKKIADFVSLLEDRIATQIKIIEKLESLIRGISNSLLYADNGTSVRIVDILKERVEKTKINNQHEVLSSTVKGIFSQREYFSKDIASENNVGYKVIRLHDVVLSPQNLWMGNINYNDRFEVGIVSPSYKIFNIAERYDKTFIASMLKTHRALYSYMLVSEQGASVVRRNLNMEAFEQLVFKIPPYEEQCKIGRTLSALHARLVNANATKTAYEQQKQWLLKQLFI